MNINEITIQIPNVDEDRDFTVTPKEVVQKAYLDTVGKRLDFFGKKRLVSSVDVTDEWITLTLQ